jgi:hypothetical protein
MTYTIDENNVIHIDKIPSNQTIIVKNIDPQDVKDKVLKIIKAASSH